MSTEITHNDPTPPPAPAHQCINAACGCNDLVSAGACCEWCMGNTTELADLQSGQAGPALCGCGHVICVNTSAPVSAGTPQRGMS